MIRISGFAPKRRWRFKQNFKFKRNPVSPSKQITLLTLLFCPGGVSYCACPPGYTSDPATGRCVDVNECLVSFPSACGRGAKCTNNEGSFSCQCGPGMTGDPVKGVCEPVRVTCSTASGNDCR